MVFFGFMKSRFIEVIEWTNTSTRTIVHLMAFENQNIRMGAALMVMESQVAVLVNEGKVADVFEPGKYTLSQENMSILSAHKSWKPGFKSPFQTEIYYVNTKQFTDMRWETVNPLIIQSTEVGPFRVKANGTYSFRIVNAEKFMKEIFGTNQIYDNSYLIGQIKSRFMIGLTELLNEKYTTLINLSFNYDELSENAENKLQEQLAPYGLELCSFIIEHIIVPDEVLAAATATAASIQATAPDDVTKRELTKFEASDIIAQAGVTSDATEMDSQQLYCQACNYLIAANMKFCPECGVKA